MPNMLLNLSGKIDPLQLALLAILNDVAASQAIPFFVIGATARDILLTHGYGIPGTRATLDVDIGVRVSGWEQFAHMKEALIETGQFSETKDAQRLLFKGELPLDVVPFGVIAHPDQTLAWPAPHDDQLMNVLGFQEAYLAAQLVRLRANPPLDILFATPASLAMMKILAWADHPSGRGKDAQDLALILRTYMDAGNDTRLAEQHSDLLNDDFDWVKAGARLLGRDIAMIAGSGTRERIAQIIEREISDQSQYRLVRAMLTGRALSDEETNDVFDEHLGLLKELAKGMKEA